MLKKMIKHIFMYISLLICIGCNDNIVGASGNCDDCVLDLSIPDVVNPASYSGSDGYANQMMGVHQEHIGDTITVHCGYYDNYGAQYLNTIRIIIDE